MRISPCKGFQWSEEDRLKLLALLGKLGYRVRMGRERPTPNGSFVYFVEFDE